MSKVVYLSFPAYGHIYPALPVIKELVNRGEEVICFSTEEFLELFKEIGAAVKLYKDSKEIEKLKQTNPAALSTQILKAGLDLLPELIAKIQALQPDYLIHDSFCAWAKILGNNLNISCICFVTTLILDPEIISRSEIFSPKLAFILSNPFSFLKMFKYKKAAGIFKNQYGISYKNPIDVLLNKQDCNLVFTSGYFQPGSEYVDNLYKFIGTSIRNEKNSEEYNNKTYHIYISLGTVNSNNINFYKLCINAFENTNYNIIISAGNEIDFIELGTIPPNISIYKHVSQIEVLQKVSLFITHGGMNSISEGLYYELPLIVIPQTGDQFITALQIQNLGAGIYIPKSKIDSKMLINSVQKILTDKSFKESSKMISKTLKDAGGYKQAANEIENFKKQNNIK